MTKKPTSGRKEPSLPTRSTATGRLSVILERVEEQQRVVIEAVTLTREAVNRRIDELDTKLSARMDVLEFVVRQNSADIRQNTADIQRNSADIQKNSADIQKNSADIQKNSADIQKNSADIQKNSADIRQISADLQTVSDKLDGKADAGQVSALEERVEAFGAEPTQS